jgi:hypothetical protein
MGDLLRLWKNLEIKSILLKEIIEIEGISFSYLVSIDDYCHAFVPLMPTFLPLFAKECTTLCQINVPLKKYPITTVN